MGRLLSFKKERALKLLVVDDSSKAGVNNYIAKPSTPQKEKLEAVLNEL